VKDPILFLKKQELNISQNISGI